MVFDAAICQADSPLEWWLKHLSSVKNFQVRKSYGDETKLGQKNMPVRHSFYLGPFCTIVTCITLIAIIIITSILSVITFVFCLNLIHINRMPWMLHPRSWKRVIGRSWREPAQNIGIGTLILITCYHSHIWLIMVYRYSHRHKLTHVFYRKSESRRRCIYTCTHTHMHMYVILIYIYIYI